jgi:hypothetical protein
VRPETKLQILSEASKYYADPLGFAMFNWPWGVKRRSLEHHPSPDEWQEQFLARLGQEVARRGFDGVHAVEPIRMAAVSGHGIGKGVALAMIATWILSTRPHAKGTVTASSWQQLQTKTWATFTTWLKSGVVAPLFQITKDKVWFDGHKDSWFVSAQSCSPENSEAFAGQHAANSTSFYLFDEASGVDDKIFETAEGGLTDGEPMIFMVGNPTRAEGAFHRATFGIDRNRWVTLSISSWDSRFTNKQQLADWRDQWGEDSDFYRVRVLGEPPRTSFDQFIPADAVAACRKFRACGFESLPKIVGVDVARYGDDRSVVFLRQGRFSKVLATYYGLDTVQVAERVVGFIETERPDAVVVDGDGLGAGVVDQLRYRNFRNGLHEFHGGGKAINGNAYFNRRAEIWGLMRDWLKAGAQIPDTAEMEVDLTGTQYSYHANGKIQLEPKELLKGRGLASPDLADALAMTFAVTVMPSTPLGVEPERISGWARPSGDGAWMS